MYTIEVFKAAQLLVSSIGAQEAKQLISELG